MGAAPTLSQQAAKDKEFQKYIDERNAELDKTVTAARTAMDGEMRTFYAAGGWNDAKPLASGAYQHLATASTWSLEHVTNMIDAVRGAVFGGPPPPAPNSNVPAPKGQSENKVEPIDQKTKNLMSLMAGTELVIANAAFQVITGILSQFKSSMETGLVKNVQQKDLTPGMSLFICVMENKYHRKDFFNDELIIQDFYIYACSFSVTRAADIANFDRIGGLIAQQHDLLSAATDISKQIADMKVADYRKKHNDSIIEAMKDYKADFAALQDVVNDVNGQVAITGRAINDMRSRTMHANAALIAAKQRELLLM